MCYVTFVYVSVSFPPLLLAWYPLSFLPPLPLLCPSTALPLPLLCPSSLPRLSTYFVFTPSPPPSVFSFLSFLPPLNNSKCPAFPASFFSVATIKPEVSFFLSACCFTSSCLFGAMTFFPGRGPSVPFGFDFDLDFAAGFFRVPWTMVVKCLERGRIGILRLGP